MNGFNTFHQYIKPFK